MIQESLERLNRRESLPISEARDLMDLVMTGRLATTQIAELLVVLKAKGESVDEIAGFAQSLRAHMVPVIGLNGQIVDGCGTGGDGAGTFNISTAASLVAASAGARVAKHGNRSVSSRSGSADLLETAGAAIDQGPEQVTRCLNELGFAFLFAPKFHPAMKHAAPARKELGTRTVFNILGPLCNPAGVKRQVIGVYDRALLSTIAEVLNRLGAEHALVVHSEDGLDELSVSAATHVIELQDGALSNSVVRPEGIIGQRFPAGSLTGGTPAENVAILRTLLSGKESAYSAAACLNAGAMLYVAGCAGSTADGYGQAKEALRSGQAATLFENWVRATRNSD